MFIYLVSCLCSFLLDSLKNYKQSRAFSWFLIGFVFIILCFGYMTGSDWRSYELIYDGEMTQGRYSLYELGFVRLLNVSHWIISDFWIFNALCKIAFLWSFVLMTKCYTDKVWTVVGASFVFSLLFMLIDCPMRFMMALTLVQLGIFSFKAGRKWMGWLLFAVSVLFHVTSLIVVLFYGSFFLFKRLINASNFLLLIVYIVFVVLPSIPAFFDFLYSRVSSISLFNRFMDAYSDYDVQTYKTIGFWKNFVLGVILILSKKHILKLKNGEELFYFSYLYFALSGVLSCIPTGFRLGILNGFFSAITIVGLLFSHDYFPSIQSYIRIGALGALIVLLSHTVSNNWKYTPYSNSIPYIVFGHLPYSYRDTYNVSYHQNH